MTTVFSVNGFMGEIFAGPQWEVAKYLEDQGLAAAQPIGYNSGAFPLSVGVNSGIAELRNQINQHPGPFLFSCWSEGAMICAAVLEQLRSGDLQHRLPDFLGAVAFGNPLREAGDWAPSVGPGAVPDPGGAGIGGPKYNMKNTPRTWANFANPGDIYACCDTGPVGDDMRLVFNFALTHWDGAIASLWDEARELTQEPGTAATSIITAVTQAIAFYSGQQRPHQVYDLHAPMNFAVGLIKNPQPTTGGTVTSPAPGTPQTAMKAWLSLIGSALAVIIPLIVQVSAGLPQPWPAVIGGVVAVLTALGVYKTPNKPKPAG